MIQKEICVFQKEICVQPSVGPVDEEEEEVFAELKQLLSSGVMSSMGHLSGDGSGISRGERRGCGH